MRLSHGLAAFALLTVGTGCADRLDGPKAVRLVDALESASRPRADSGQRAGWWDFLFGSDWLSIASHASDLPTVVLRLDGHPVTYHALVFERVTALPADVPCAGTLWSVFLWRAGDAPEGVGFIGGRFDQPIGTPMHWCQDHHLFYIRGPEPALWRSTPPDGPHYNNWAGTDGRGDITAGVITSSCMFLTPEAERRLLEERGMSCSLTRHRVWFRGELRREVATPRGGAPMVSDTSALVHMELEPTDVLGVRYTVHCDKLAGAFPPKCPRK